MDHLAPLGLTDLSLLKLVFINFINFNMYEWEVRFNRDGATPLCFIEIFLSNAQTN